MDEADNATLAFFTNPAYLVEGDGVIRGGMGTRKQ